MNDSILNRYRWWLYNLTNSQADIVMSTAYLLWVGSLVVSMMAYEAESFTLAITSLFFAGLISLAAYLG